MSLRFVFLFFLISFSASAQKDYKLWLQYNAVNNSALASEYKNNLKGFVVLGNSETIKIAEKESMFYFQCRIFDKILIQKMQYIK